MAGTTKRRPVRDGSAFPRLPRRFAPRNDTSGEREVHQRPPTVELLPTGRSLSAATDPVGGGCHFNDSLCESFVQHREVHAPPLQWRVPRNGGRYGTAVPSRDCHVASLLAMARQEAFRILHSSFFSLQDSFISVPRPYSELPGKAQKKLRSFDRSFMLALPIFPCSHPQSIVGANELNFCVRDGNRCTLTAINTNYLGTHPEN